MTSFKPVSLVGTNTLGRRAKDVGDTGKLEGRPTGRVV